MVCIFVLHVTSEKVSQLHNFRQVELFSVGRINHVLYSFGSSFSVLALMYTKAMIHASSRMMVMIITTPLRRNRFQPGKSMFSQNRSLGSGACFNWILAFWKRSRSGSHSLKSL